MDINGTFTGYEVVDMVLVLIINDHQWHCNNLWNSYVC